MARFVKLYLNPSNMQDKITDYVNRIFQKFDVNRNGYLDKRECLALLDEVALNQGQDKVTIPQFIRFFAEYDINHDGYISKKECARFVKKLLGNPLSVQDKASSMMRDIELEKQRKLEDMALLRPNRN
jgi:Ca2+-binding EF-hand superfamily protein